MMRWTFLLLFSLLLLSTGCSQPRDFQEFTGERFIMDTLIRITVICKDEQQGKKALNAAFEEFERINALTNRFGKGKEKASLSEVMNINQNASLNPVKVGRDIQTMLERSNHFARLTDGAFDVSVGPAMDLWGFGGGQRVPKDNEIKRSLDLVGYKKVHIDQQGYVFLTQRGMSIDLGGVAKGYATDLAAKVLKKMGIKHAMINAGGNVYALGSKPGGSPWRVGVQDPRNPQGLVAILQVKDVAVVTSGDYQRYFEEDGVRYHHILDPATGKQVRGVMQTTVVCSSATDADILSTALFVLGPQKGMEFVQTLSDTEAIFIGSNKQISITNQLNKQLELTGEGGYQSN